MLVRVALIVLACAAALTGVACGGTSDGDGSSSDEAVTAYVLAVNRGHGTIDKLMSSIADSTEATGTPASDAQTLRRYESAVEQVTKELAALEVPPAARGPHATMIKALTDYGAAIGVARRELGSATAGEVGPIRARLAAATAVSSRELDGVIAMANRELATASETTSK